MIQDQSPYILVELVAIEMEALSVLKCINRFARFIKVFTEWFFLGFQEREGKRAKLIKHAKSN
jgi:hypothetical protein